MAAAAAARMAGLPELQKYLVSLSQHISESAFFYVCMRRVAREKCTRYIILAAADRDFFSFPSSDLNGF